MDARDTEKAPDAFRTISEVAEDLALPQHVLRFWETRFPQIKPIKRAGGRRFYRPEDVDLLRGIRHLLYTDGFTIKGAQRILKDQGVRYVQDLGIEREVAVMRSAKPQRSEAGDGVTFGGLLGLLPRRKPKAPGGRAAEDDDLLPELPEAAELPLPFPDAEADRDLADEPPEPPIAFRPAARHRDREPQLREERRAAAFEAPGQRREPTLGEELPHPPSGAPHLAPHGAPHGAPPRTRERLEPILAPQRPSRGPAARVSQRDTDGTAPPSHSPAFDDPLLPFLDDMPVTVSAVSEPIEARIQRLRAQERRPMRPHEALEDVEGPEDDIPPRARRAPSPLDLPLEEGEAMRPAPRRPSAPAEARRPAWEEDERLQDERLDDEPLEDDRFDDPFAPHPRRSPQIKAYQDDDEPPAPAPQRRAATTARSEPPRFQEPNQDPRQGQRRETRQDQGRDPRQGRIVQDGEWRQTDWVEATWHGVAEDRTRLPEAVAPSEDDEPLYRPIERPSRAPRPGAMAADPETEMMNEERRRPPFSPPRGERREPSMSAAPKGAATMGTAPMTAPPFGSSAGRAPMAHAPAAAASAAAAHARPPAGWADEEVRRVWDEGWGEGAPQSLPRATRVGPLIGPIHDEDDPNSGVLPEAEQRRIAERMAGRAVAPDPYVAQRRGPPPWSRAEAPLDLPNPSFRDGSTRGEAPAYAPEPEPPAQRVPREPLRPGPPEQYLPPHLRSEPRMAGQPPMAAPVLSRDDVHRMQSALYELGECRRLMEEVLAPRDGDRPGD